MTARALVLLLALAIVACGKAGPPVAPELRVPASATDLRGRVEDGAVILEWANPQRRVDQSRLADLAEVRLYRVEDDGTTPPRSALLVGKKISGWTEIATIRLDAPEPAVIQGQTVRFVDREGVRIGRRYTYVVLAEDGRGRVSAPSARASVTLIAPPEAPVAPLAEAGEGEVRLRWQAPGRLVDGGAPGPLTYEVTRSSSADGPPEATFRVPAGQTQYVDQSVENDRTYYYAVRAIRDDAGSTARGEFSPRVAATPARTTPPAPPRNLVATPSRGTVLLSWAASSDPNAVVYVVYRARGREDFARIGTTRVPATTFADRNVPAGTYRYVVTAQDATARANESTRTNVVTVTVR